MDSPSRSPSQSAIAYMDALDFPVALHIWSFFKPQQALAASSVCKLFNELTKQPFLWRHYYARDVTPAVHALLGSPSGPDHDWHLLCRKAVSLQALRYAKWERLVLPAGSARPCAREGHAAQPWAGQSMLLFGGWGSGIRNDLFELRPPPAAQPGALQAVNQRRWEVPTTSGRRPEIRYGHSATRCGEHGDLLVVYGGMQAGGYCAEIEKLAVLARAVKASGEAGPSGSALTDGSDDESDEVQYEWRHPKLSGVRPVARGYHGACASADGRKVFIFGGMCRRDCCNTLAVIDTVDWVCERPATHGTPPSPRFGHSQVIYNNKLWIVGGGYGNDLARSGHDLEDIHTLDLSTMQWAQVQTTNPVPDARVLGRCHSAHLLGSKLVLFGGSMELGNSITWLDLETATWGAPVVLGDKPVVRMSSVLVGCGLDLIMMGGFIYSHGEVGDTYRLKLHLDDVEMAGVRTARAATLASRPTRQSLPSIMSRPVPEDDVCGGSGAAAAAVATPGTAESGEGGGATAGGGFGTVVSVVEMLNACMARNFRLSRQAAEQEEEVGRVDDNTRRMLAEVRAQMHALRSRAAMEQVDHDDVSSLRQRFWC